LNSEGVPPFSKNANDVMVRTLDLETSGIEMARIILKDLGLTSQILRLANSAMYNRSGRPILSVAHAIVLLGWDRVRSLVSTVRFIEHFQNRSPGLRELLLLSVLSAVHCRDVATAVGYPRPEEAYICGLFRNIGEVLIGCHYPVEYANILLAMQNEKIPQRAACLRVLDFAWDEVGLRVAARWNMPSRIRRSMAGAETSIGSVLDRSAASITDYARELTHALYREGSEIDSVHLRCVLGMDGRQALVSVRDLHRIVDSAARETLETFAALGVPTTQLRLERQAERARTILDALQVFDAAALQALDQAIDGLLRKLRQPEFELTGFVTSLLDTLVAAGFERAVFGLVNEDHTMVRGRLASGDAVDDLLGHFQFPIDNADGPIRAALERRTDVLVDRKRDDRYDTSLLVATAQPAAFALFPIIIDGQTAGCLYADRRSPSPGLDMVRPSLARVRDAIAAAIRKMASPANARR
jgi:HD-like signal output (HDOD) protein